MAAVLPYLKNPLVFGPEATRAMSVAFDDVCRALNVSYTANGAREAIATRIIELARHGEYDPDRLRARVITEANALWRLRAQGRDATAVSGTKHTAPALPAWLKD